MPRVRGLMSTNTGLKPHWITEAMSETQVRVGTMTSPGPKVSRSAVMVRRLAEAPELTNTLCLTPSQADHSCSNDRTWRDCVSIGLSWRRYSMSASRSARGMFLCISSQSRGAGAAPDWAAFFLLFVVVVAILNHDRALAVFSFKGPLVGGKYILRLFQPDHLDVLAHQAKRIGEVAHMLILRMQRPHRADAGPDDHFRPVTAVGHQRELVQVIHYLVDRQQQKVPPGIDAYRNMAGQGEPAGHPHLQLLSHRQLDQLVPRHVF